MADQTVAAEEKPAPPAEMAEVDRLKLQLGDERVTRIQAQMTALGHELKVANTSLTLLQNDMRKKYELSPTDEVDMRTGKIVRKTQAEKKSN
jgi:hypothetical protein